MSWTNEIAEFWDLGWISFISTSQSVLDFPSAKRSYDRVLYKTIGAHGEDEPSIVKKDLYSTGNFEFYM